MRELTNMERQAVNGGRPLGLPVQYVSFTGFSLTGLIAPGRVSNASAMVSGEPDAMAFANTRNRKYRVI